MSVIAWNEISKNANGGTEQVARMLESSLDGRFDDFQIIPSRIRELDSSKYRVYWLHDLAEDPETSHLRSAESRNRFHKLVFCGNWQRAEYQSRLDVPIDDHSVVIDTPVAPVQLDRAAKDGGPIRLVYTSTPQRGLDILVSVFIELAKKYPNIHLDVFSSFKIYGFDGADAQFEDLFRICRDHPQITYHGVQPNEVVREHLVRSHIFAYPSTWMECNSRSLIEAMSSGLLCVHSDLGGLPDTSGGMTMSYPYSPDKNRHAQVFYKKLEEAIGLIGNPVTDTTLRFVKDYACRRYSPRTIMAKWESLLTDIRQEYQGRGLVTPANLAKKFEL